MSKKDYIAIAEIISDLDTDSIAQQSVAMYKSLLVARLSWLFERDNKLFSSAKFRAACYHNTKGDNNE